MTDKLELIRSALDGMRDALEAQTLEADTSKALRGRISLRVLDLVEDLAESEIGEAGDEVDIRTFSFNLYFAALSTLVALTMPMAVRGHEDRTADLLLEETIRRIEIGRMVIKKNGGLIP